MNGERSELRVAAVDGGGTHTRVWVVSGEGSVLGRGEGPSGNLHDVGRARLAEHLGTEGLFVKLGSETGFALGGNKVRKLEFLLVWRRRTRHWKGWLRGSRGCRLRVCLGRRRSFA